METNLLATQEKTNEVESESGSNDNTMGMERGEERNSDKNTTEFDSIIKSEVMIESKLCHQII